MTSVHDLEPFAVTTHGGPDGKLVSYQSGDTFALDIRRVFLISGNQGATRGRHAHRRLTQVLVCVHGACTVVCDDGCDTRSFALKGFDTALAIPPGIWAEQTYETDDSVLMVMCDLDYDESDYIREYAEFLEFTKEQSA